jgi:hypothetical protein
MLATVANMKEQQATIISARANAGERIKPIETFMSHREWPDEVGAAIKHYLLDTNPKPQSIGSFQYGGSVKRQDGALLPVAAENDQSISGYVGRNSSSCR